MDRPKADSVLVLSGLDPSGAAGIAADIETINQFGLTPLPIITLLTAQNTQKVESLEVIKTAFVDEGPTMKRFRPAAMGRAVPIFKRSSHLTVIISDKKN